LDPLLEVQVLPWQYFQCILKRCTVFGAITQLARVSALQAKSREFESH
jgi:calcineurin-like phosphoesterase family protein